MPYTEASKRATIKYINANYDKIEVKTRKGNKSTIKAAAEEAGQSVNAYILQAIEERMQRDHANK